MAPRITVQVTPQARPALRPEFGTRLAGLPALLRSGASAVLNREGARDARIEITVVHDAHIASLNERYLLHEGPTDVIAFSLDGAGCPAHGDVYIGAEQAVRNARAYGIPLREELLRLAVHGTLHVLGYDHEADASRTEGEMWAVQESIVASLLEP